MCVLMFLRKDTDLRTRGGGASLTPNRASIKSFMTSCVDIPLQLAHIGTDQSKFAFDSQQKSPRFCYFRTKRDASDQRERGVSRYSVVRKAATFLQPQPKKSHEWEAGKIASP